MAFPQIEKMKTEFTDQYVQVHGDRPELARFNNLVGQVKTVNMSGRALVEFIDYHLNIGWYDIDVDYLKVVDKPLPKEKKPAAKKPAAKKPAAKKPTSDGAGEKKLSPLELARMQDAGDKKAPAAEPKSKAAPAPAKSGGSEKPAKVDRSKMSVAEMLAAARAEKNQPAASDAALPPAEETPDEAPAEPEVESPKPAATADGDTTKVDRSSMSVAEMIAYCREKDA